MKRYRKIHLNGKDHIIMDRVATVLRILSTPILVWYRLYLWVWDGTMFDKKH